MSPFIAEVIGTGILVLLGNGVVANVVLNKTKGHQSGWIVISWGWAMGVFAGVFTVAQFSGAPINPAVTVGLAVAGLFDLGMVIPYIIAQIIGAALGSLLVWLAYKDHFAVTHNKDLVLGLGLSLGGPTGYAINPARDLGPRIMHALLPIPTKGSNDWSYSWIPVLAPLTGATLAAGLYLVLG